MKKKLLTDNIQDLYKLFEKEYGDQHPDGYLYRCKHCSCATYCAEFFAPCQQQFVPEKIKCPKCGAHWKLHYDLCMFEGESYAKNNLH